MEQKVLRVGILVIACALVLQLFGAGMLDSVQKFSLPQELASWIIFFQTGRLVRPDHIIFTPQESTQPLPETIPEGTEPSAPTQITIPVFSPEDVSDMKINSGFSFTADLSALITKPLDWDLTGEEPTVLIVHTHGTESFAPTGDYQQTTPYHTLDKDHNMVSIGGYVADLLKAGGISVLQDTTLHDDPHYNDAYNNSRESIQKYLKEYPSIRLVLDLHRDSFEDEGAHLNMYSTLNSYLNFGVR